MFDPRCRKNVSSCRQAQHGGIISEHLRFANTRAPEHLATYHVLGQTLIRLREADEARRVLEEGIRRVSGVGHGMGRDLGPAMQALLDTI